MYKKTSIFFVSALLFFQVSNAVLAPLAAADDAKALLDQLRNITIDALKGAFADHVSMSDSVDSTAQDTKTSGATDQLVACVNDQAEETLDLIYTAAVTITDTFLTPIFEGEKKLVGCLATDEKCVSGVIEEIQSAIDTTPDGISAEILSDRQKVTTQISLVEACASLGAKIQKPVALGDLVEAAKTALARLQRMTLDNLVLAFGDYVSFFDSVDSTAQDTKGSGENDALVECVNGHADEAVDFIHAGFLTLVQTFLRPLYDEETQLVVCGVSDGDCISVVITDLVNKIRANPGDFNNDVQMDGLSVNDHIAAMKACGSQK